MTKNEYKSIEQFTSQYVGEWNPSEGHWFGLDFVYEGIEYRFNTGCMYDESCIMPDGRDVLFTLYRKKKYTYTNKKEYELIDRFSDMKDVLESRAIKGKLFKDIIIDNNTELVGQD